MHWLGYTGIPWLGGIAFWRSNVSIAGFLLALSVIFAAGQDRPAKTSQRSNGIDARTHETDQRVQRLLLFEPEIAELTDVEARSQLRYSILEFIFSNKARTKYADAERLLETFFEDLAANGNDADRTGFWRNRLALMLRRQAPEIAKKFESRFVPVVDTAGEDQQALRMSGTDRKPIVDRAVELLRSGDNILSVQGTFEFMKLSNDHEAAERILMAALNRAERDPSPEAAYLLYRLIDFPLNPPAWSISPSNRIRYYRALVAGSEIQISTARSYTSIVSATRALRNSLAGIKKLDEPLYSDARSILDRYRRTLSDEEREEDEGFERIEASDDRLRQTIVEAEAATAQRVKDRFWTFAATLAVLKNDFNQATDLIMRASSDLGIANRPNGRDEEMLSRVILHAMRRRDFAAANYALNKIENRLIRAKALFEAGAEYDRVESDRRHAVPVVEGALTLMESTVPDIDSICKMSTSRAILARGGQAHLISQAFTRRAVDTVNRIPPVTAEPDAASREEADPVVPALVRGMPCVGSLFQPVLNIIPHPDLAQRITVREWRLAALIEAEKSRRHPLPAPLLK